MARTYSDDDLIRFAKEVTSFADLLRKLNLKTAGGNYASVKKLLQQLNVNCDHWTGQAWSKEKRLKDWSQYTKISSIRVHLIKERGHKCENCKRSKWMGVVIPIEVDHIDGDRTNNSLDNLMLLCCNCHALTKNWRGRKNKGCKGVPRLKILNKCQDCGVAIRKSSKRCPKCYQITQKKVERPLREDLIKMVKEHGYCKTGRMFGVSDTAVRKWLIVKT